MLYTKTMFLLIRFLNQKSLEAGKIFWRANRASLCCSSPIGHCQILGWLDIWFDPGWLSSALGMLPIFSKHHKQLRQIRRTDSGCPRLS